MKYSNCKTLQDGDRVIICDIDTLRGMYYAVTAESFLKYADEEVVLTNCYHLKDQFVFSIAGEPDGWRYNNDAIVKICINDDPEFEIESEAEYKSFLFK